MENVILKWSPQQQDFLDWCENGEGSCVLEAVAGAGKTTVLLEGGARMGDNVLYLAYNKAIADETSAKLKARNVDWKTMRASTVHAAGFNSIRKATSGVKVDDKKVMTLFERFAPELLKPRMGEVCALVSLAKQSAFGSAGPSIEDNHAWLDMADHFGVFDNDTTDPSAHTAIIDLARKLLIESNKDLETVDFDDMVYLPVLHQLPMWRHNVVMVDEAQDTNAARRALVRALVRKGGRVIAVGDPHQAIYGFTGADSDALELIAKDFNCVHMPLTITYRCPKKVVDVARQWVSHISAADTAPEGAVDSTTLDEFYQRNDLNGRAAVLCRVNAPLIQMAFALIRRRIPCKVAGRDVGGNLKKLLTRWKITKLEKLEERLDDHLQRQTTRLLAKKQESRVAALEDLVGTCKVIIDQCRKEKKYTVADAVAFVDGIFTDQSNENLILLSSIHKAKGREWPHVFWLDRANTCPNKWARQDWQQEQEKNLMYVAATRAQERLTDIIVDGGERE